MAKTNAINNASSSLTVNSAYTLPASDGTSNQVLQTNGSGTVSFASASGGSLAFIDSQTASGASSVQFTSGISSSYDQYLLKWIGGSLSSTVPVLLQISTDGGSSYISTSYQGGGTWFAWNGTTPNNSNSSAGFVIMNPAANTGMQSETWLNFTPSSIPCAHGKGKNLNAMCITMGTYNSSVTVNAFQVLPTSGTISGDFYLYGFSNS